MPDDDSEFPLLKVNTLTITAPGDYQTLLEIESDPNTILRIGDIIIDCNATTTLPFINIFLNGTPYVKDTPIFNVASGIGFGRHLILRNHSKPIRIEIKTTAVGTLIVNGWVNGLEIRDKR